MDKIPFGNLVVKNEFFSKFAVTDCIELYHAYSELVLDYLAKKYNNKNSCQTYIMS
jgi:hypothetical protein